MIWKSICKYDSPHTHTLSYLGGYNNWQQTKFVGNKLDGVSHIDKRP